MHEKNNLNINEILPYQFAFPMLAIANKIFVREAQHHFHRYEKKGSVQLFNAT